MRVRVEVHAVPPFHLRRATRAPAPSPAPSPTPTGPRTRPRAPRAAQQLAPHLRQPLREAEEVLGPQEEPALRPAATRPAAARRRAALRAERGVGVQVGAARPPAVAPPPRSPRAASTSPTVLADEEGDRRRAAASVSSARMTGTVNGKRRRPPPFRRDLAQERRTSRKHFGPARGMSLDAARLGTRNAVARRSSPQSATAISHRPMTALPTRDDALALVHEYTASDSLRKHMLAVEAAMRAYADAASARIRSGGGSRASSTTSTTSAGPTRRTRPRRSIPSEGVRILRERGWPEDILEAILGHGDYTGVPRVTPLAQDAVRRRRAHRADHRHRARAPVAQRARGGRAVRAEEDEGQGVRSRRQPRRRLAGARRARRRSRRAHRLRRSPPCAAPPTSLGPRRALRAEPAERSTVRVQPLVEEMTSPRHGHARDHDATVLVNARSG